HFYIGHCLHLEQKFVPRSLGGISCTTFLSTQNRKGNPRLVQNFYQGLCNSFCPIVKTPHTAHPKEDLRLLSVRKKLGHCSHFQFFLHFFSINGEKVQTQIQISNSKWFMGLYGY